MPALHKSLLPEPQKVLAFCLFLSSCQQLTPLTFFGLTLNHVNGYIASLIGEVTRYLMAQKNYN